MARHRGDGMQIRFHFVSVVGFTIKMKSKRGKICPVGKIDIEKLD